VALGLLVDRRRSSSRPHAPRQRCARERARRCEAALITIGDSWLLAKITSVKTTLMANPMMALMKPLSLTMACRA
jgi:hypothetical protein